MLGPNQSHRGGQPRDWLLAEGANPETVSPRGRRGGGGGAAEEGAHPAATWKGLSLPSGPSTAASPAQPTADRLVAAASTDWSPLRSHLCQHSFCNGARWLAVQLCLADKYTQRTLVWGSDVKAGREKPHSHALQLGLPSNARPNRRHHS